MSTRARSHHNQRSDDTTLTFRPRSSSASRTGSSPRTNGRASRPEAEEVEEPLYEVEDIEESQVAGGESFNRGPAEPWRPEIQLTDDGPYMDASGYRKPSSSARFRPAGALASTPLSQPYARGASAQATGDLSGARRQLEAQNPRSQRRSGRTGTQGSWFSATVASLKERVSRHPRESGRPASGRAASAGRGGRATSAVGSKLGDDFKGVRTSRRGRPKGDEGGEAPKAPWHVRLRVPLAILGLCLVVMAILYPPACDYYRARRDGEIYQAQLDAFNALNEEEKARIHALNTEQGIEDEARIHGYVRQGEQAVTVSGLPEEGSAGQAAPIPDDIKADVLARQDPWYVQALDVLFGYKKGT